MLYKLVLRAKADVGELIHLITSINEDKRIDWHSNKDLLKMSFILQYKDKYFKLLFII